MATIRVYLLVFADWTVSILRGSPYGVLAFYCRSTEAFLLDSGITLSVQEVCAPEIPLNGASRNASIWLLSRLLATYNFGALRTTCFGKMDCFCKHGVPY